VRGELGAEHVMSNDLFAGRSDVVVTGWYAGFRINVLLLLAAADGQWQQNQS
jgi:hypothetical protein